MPYVWRVDSLRDREEFHDRVNGVSVFLRSSMPRGVLIRREPGGFHSVWHILLYRRVRTPCLCVIRWHIAFGGSQGGGGGEALPCLVVHHVVRISCALSCMFSIIAFYRARVYRLRTQLYVF